PGRDLLRPEREPRRPGTPGELTMSRVNITPITETQTVKVGHTFTVTLSEREAAVLAYLLGRTPVSLLEGNTTLYESLTDAIGDDTTDWGSPSNFLPSLATSDKIRERLQAYSNRYE